MSRQLVNFHKSAYQCSKNVNRTTRESFESILEMKAVMLLDKYLGCPLIHERVNNTTFQNVVERTTNNLTKWKTNSLSKAGRVTLIQATLASTPMYSMQSFMLPKQNLDELDRINRNFCCNKNQQNRGENLVG